MIAEISLIVSLLGLAYIYLGYPLCIMLISRLKSQTVRKAEYRPSVTILIAAYNEAESIEATIRNKLALEYPAEKLEIIVISDGSTDGTEEIVGRFHFYGARD